MGGYSYESNNDGWATFIIIVLFFTTVTIFSYTQRYVENRNDTATKGLWFTTTINLSKYNQIGEGRGLFGKYDVITRSAMQGKDESIRIYK